MASEQARGNQIIEFLKKKSDEDYIEEWASWKPGEPPLLAAEIEEKLKIRMQSAQITFMGVWDTVPGSSLKDYGNCGEQKGFIKEDLHWLIPGIDKGERYKSGSYPPIRRIAHAVSIDEKRNKFAPLLLCPPLNPQLTKTFEVWFPGAHVDVGGGYEDSDELPRISLAWIIEQLNQSYEFGIRPPVPRGDANGLAHWSLANFPANVGSECEDRKPSDDAVLHKSYFQRKDSVTAPIRWGCSVKSLPYPIGCADLQQ